MATPPLVSEKPEEEEEEEEKVDLQALSQAVPSCIF